MSLRRVSKRQIAPLLAAVIWVVPAVAQADSPADLFTAQCAACHTLSAKDPMRQGPNLGNVYGRKVGSVAGFAYSPDYTKANFVWDAAHLDAYLANPASVLPDSYMAYQQPDAAIRAEIIGYLKQQAPLYADGK